LQTEGAGAEYSSTDAHRWRSLPLSGLPPQLAHLRTLFDSTVRDGHWYCSVLLLVPGDSIPHPGGGYHLEWHTRGIHGTEIPDGQHPVITTFGILDREHRRLYAWIGFSG